MVLALRVLATLPYCVWPQTARAYFYIEGVYIILLGFIPMDVGILRNFATFSVLIQWLLLYYTDFLANWLFLNLVSIVVYFVAYPLTYPDEGPKEAAIVEKILFVLWLNVCLLAMELLSVYVERVCKNYEE